MQSRHCIKESEWHITKPEGAESTEDDERKSVPEDEFEETAENYGETAKEVVNATNVRSVLIRHGKYSQLCKNVKGPPHRIGTSIATRFKEYWTRETETTRSRRGHFGISQPRPVS